MAGNPFDKWVDSPAQPSGMRDAAASTPAGGGGNPFAQWSGRESAQQWYGGRNLRGTENGWDTDFYRRAMTQQREWTDRAAKEQKASVYFDQFDTTKNKTATGVVLWDDEKRGLKRGDVFDGGVKRENLYDIHSKEDADLLLVPWLFDGKEQKDMFRKGPDEVARRVQEKTDRFTDQALKAPTAEEFASEVEDRKKGLQDSSALGSVAAGAGGGAALGAGVGSIIFPVAGTAIGAVVGTVVGGIGGFLNRDQFTELVAVTQEQAEVAGRDKGRLQGTLAQVGGWGKVAMTASSPLQNTVQGAFDAKEGRIGDLRSEFYAVDPATGQRKASGGWQAANLVAAVPDSLAQFASPVSRGLSYSWMGAAVVESTGSVATGQVFDPTAGVYHDLSGAKEWGAAAGSAAIDAVQLGVARGLARSTAATRSNAGLADEAVVTARGGAPQAGRIEAARVQLGTKLDDFDRFVDRRWAQLKGRELPASYTSQTVNGIRFLTDDAGEVVAKRLTAQIIAPSEFTKWLPTGWRARTMKAADAGMPTADDYLRAAHEMARSGSRFTNAVINAQGEASEEMLQAYLEPQSYGESSGWGDIWMAGAAGAAAGFGMGMGATWGRASAQQMIKGQARAAYEALRGTAMTDQEWDSFSAGLAPEVLELMAGQDPSDVEALADLGRAADALHQHESGPGSVLGKAAEEALREHALSQMEGAAQPNHGGNMVALPMSPDKLVLPDGSFEESLFGPNAGVMSSWRLAELLRRKVDAFSQHRAEMEKRLTEAKAALAAATDPAAQARMQAAVAALDKDLLDQEGLLAAVERIAAEARGFHEALAQEDRPEAQQMLVDEMNRRLQEGALGRWAGNLDPEAVRRSVELLFGRHPFMDQSSLVRFVPQVSLGLTLQGADGSVHMHQAGLKALAADHDGDFLVSMNGVYLPQEQRAAIRRGAQYYKTAESEAKLPPAEQTGRQEVILGVPDLDAKLIEQFSRYFDNPADEHALIVQRHLTKLGDRVKARYTPVLGPRVTEMWDAFETGIKDNDPDARLNLINGLLNLDTEAFKLMGDAQGVPEAVFLTEWISLTIDQITQDLSKYDIYLLDQIETLSPAQAAAQRQFLRDRQTLEAETFGATAALILGPDAQRSTQKLNYLALLKAAIDTTGVDADGLVTEPFQRLAFEYMRLSSHEVETAQDLVDNADAVNGRVVAWLRRLAQEWMQESGQPEMSLETAMVLLANAQVGAVDIQNASEVYVEDGTLTMLQLLLRRSVSIEQQNLRNEPKDSAGNKRLRRLRRLTEARPTGSEHSYSASAAFLEVLGDIQLERLLGDDAGYLGATKTLRQHVDFLQSKSVRGRKAIFDKYTSHHPAWLKGHEFGDPPYTVEQLSSGQLNAYTVVVHAMKTMAYTRVINLRKTNETAHANALKAFASIRQLIDARHDEIAADLRSRDPEAVVDREAVLGELLRQYPDDLAKVIVSMIPVESLPAVFRRDPETGEVLQARWIMEALLQDDAEKAVLLFYVHSNLDHLALLSRGESDVTEEGEQFWEGQLDYSRVRSRFQQTLVQAGRLAASDGGLTLQELQRAMFESPSLDALFEQINANPMLMGDRAELIPWHDDVSEYEASPADALGGAQPSANLREAYEKAAARLEVLSSVERDAAVARRSEQKLLRKMDVRLRELGDEFDRGARPQDKGMPSDPVDKILESLRLATVNAPLLVDGNGPNAVRQALEAMQSNLFIGHDKGKPDERIGPLGQLLPFNMGFGLKQGIRLEVDNITVISWQDASANPTKLAEAPTWVQFEDGSMALVDVTTVRGALDMLMDPTTNGLAKAILFPHVKDIDANNQLQDYLLTLAPRAGDLEGLLEEQHFAHLFNGSDAPTTRQALTLMSLVQSYLLKTTERDDRETREFAKHAIQRILDDFVVSYSLSPNASGLSDGRLLDNAIVNVMHTLQQLSKVPPDVRGIVREQALGLLAQQFEGESQRIENAIADAQAAGLDLPVADLLLERIMDQVADLENQLQDQTKTEAQRAWISHKLEVLNTSLNKPLSQLMREYDPSTYLTLARAQERFSIDHSSPEAEKASAEAVFRFLVNNERLLHFRDDKTIDLIANVLDLAGKRPDGMVEYSDLTAKQWDQLSKLAVRAVLVDTVSPVAATVGLPGLKEDDADLFFDPAYSFLLEPLFDERVLNAVAYFADAAGYNLDNDPSVNSAALAEQVVSRLFNPRLLGPRPATLPSVLVKSRKPLAASTAETAIQAAGVNPKEAIDLVAASMVTLLPPPPESMTVTRIDIAANASDLYTAIPAPLLVKLEHHFAANVAITDPTGTIPADVLAGVFARVGTPSLQYESVRDSGLLVLELAKLQREVDGLLADHQVPGLQIEIEFVDIDKIPVGAEWAHNIYFDGVAREFEANAGVNPIASLFFAPGGLNKIAQQAPLDAAKGGKGFLAHVVQGRDLGRSLEAQADSVTELMALKALALWPLEYDTGYLLRADIPTLHKLMRMRHVVRRPAAAGGGDPVLMWPDQAIALEAQERAAGQPVSPYEVIPLSEQVADTLWAANSPRGVTGGYEGPPVVNAQDLNAGYPSLDQARLDALGIGRLGQTTKLSGTAAAQVRVRPRARTKDDVGTKVPVVPRTRLTVLGEEAKRILLRRAESRWDGAGISERNERRIATTLGYEPLLTRILGGVTPASAAHDPARQASAEVLSANLAALKLTPGNMTWLFQMGDVSRMAEGILTSADHREGYEAGEGFNPGIALGDVVAIDLGSILAMSNGMSQDALDYTKQVMEKLALKGVRFALVSSEGGSPVLRSHVEDWISSGGLPYAKVAGSSHFYEPKTERANKTLEAEARSLSSTEVFTAEGATFAVIARDEVGLNEGGSFIDYDMDSTWRRAVVTMFPAEMLQYGAGKTPYAFNIASPTAENGRQAAQMVASLRALLLTKEGRAYLRKIAGGDPPNTPIRRYNEGTKVIEPGVRSIDDAMDELLAILDSGDISKLYEQRLLVAGDIVPLIDGYGNIMLWRYGFKPPKNLDTLKDKDVERDAIPDLPIDARFAISRPKTEGRMTVPPEFFVEELLRATEGIKARGQFALNSEMKLIWEGMGLKEGPMHIPNTFNLFRDVALGIGGGTHITRLVSEEYAVGKGATSYRVDNFTDAMAVFGWSFKQDLVDFFFPTGTRPELSAAQKWDLVKLALDQWSHMDHGLNEQQLVTMLDADVLLFELRDSLRSVLGPAFGNTDALLDGLTQPMGPAEDVTRRIATNVLAVLTLPGVHTQHVLESTGLLEVDAPSLNRAQIMRPPALLGQLFARPFDFPKTQAEMFRRFNSKFARDPQTGQARYALNENWEFQYAVDMPIDNTGGTTRGLKRGTLQYVLPVPAEQNAATYTQRLVMAQRQDLSSHVASLVNAAFGGRVLENDIDPETLAESTDVTSQGLQDWYSGSALPVDPDSGEAGYMWRLLSGVSLKKDSFNDWNALTYLEAQALDDGREAMAAYFQTIDRSRWTEEEKQVANALAHRVLRKMNLDTERGASRLLDTLVRQYVGSPGRMGDQTEYVESVRVDDYMEALNAFLDNLNENKIPTLGGEVPLLHADMLRRIFNAQRGKQDPWAPAARDVKGKRIVAEEWNDWVASAIGQVTSSSDYFESMFGSALNGFWQSYNGTSSLTENLGITMDEDLNAKLKSYNLNRDLSTLFAYTEAGEAMVDRPIVLETQSALLDALTGKTPAQFTATAAEESAESRKAFNKRRRAAWRAGKKMPKQEQKSIGEYRKDGAMYLENNNRANILMHNVANLSLINRLLNPAIYVGGLIEMPIRASFDAATSFLYGDKLGASGVAVARMGEKVGLQSKFTPEQVQLLNALASKLADSNEWVAELENELTYTYVEKPVKDVGRKTQKLDEITAGVTRFMSNPAYRQRSDALARAYITAVWEYLAMTNNIITVEQFVQVMNENPMWVRDNFQQDRFNPHKAGLNRIAQLRITKPTMLARPFTKGISRMRSSSSTGLNFAGHLLHLPFMFANFNANMLTTMTGMSGWDQAAAMFFDRRRKPSFLLKRDKGEVASEADLMDFSDIIETLDLQRTFIRSGLTSTMLFTLALMVGNLGFDGDDEEERRRQRLAKYTNIPLYTDPTLAQNQFTYADAVFLDEVSIFGINNIFMDATGRSAVVPHWMIRQFTSPILGIQRFFDSGDLNEIRYGFADAMSVIPNSVLNIWRQADETAGILAEQAANEDGVDTEESRGAVNKMLVQIVGIYERALLENAFVNSLYQASDRYDRDAYALPALSDTGEIEREEGTGLPKRSTSLQSYVDPETGEVKQGYTNRDGLEGDLYNYAKGNAVLGHILALFTGMGDSQFLRKNMPVKERKIEMPETSEAQAEAFMLSALEGRGATWELSRTEIAQLLKSAAAANDEWWDAGEIEAEANRIYEARSNKTQLSVYSEEAGEVLTEAGAESIYASLMKGSIQLGDPALRGIAIPREMREKVATKILQEIAHDAMELGMTEEQAGYVVRRYWFGDPLTGVPGLLSLVNSKEIPQSNVVKYNQLNVTYEIGPDGKPWATPFERATLFGALGIPMPQQSVLTGAGTTLDASGRVVDEVLGINTGLHALERKPEPEMEPIKIDLDEVTKAGAAKAGTTGGRGYYSRRRGGGGYSGGGYRANIYFSPMRALPDSTAARVENIPMINTSNPIIRRARINRERVFSERGRLKQWQ